MKTIIVILSITVLFAACTPKQQQNASDKTIDLKKTEQLGDSISMVLQQVLLQNVSSAMQKGGAPFAIQFCNEKALKLTDSIAELYDCKIQRITDKNRNPVNLASEQDIDFIKQLETSNQKVLDIDSASVFYKPIKIPSKACLSCHGTEQEIAPQTASLIQKLYPNDKATGYSEGDLRGWWKIVFKK